MGHKAFLFFLIMLALISVLAVSIRGCGYYVTPVSLRPQRADYDLMRPTGTYSHGLGVVGAGMVTIGVLSYSLRKRVRSFRTAGKLSIWLEVHIFLCLLGPILVVFHTTFKAGGVAAISLWAMLSVWASGMVGRFLYTQIPRNLQGVELTAAEVRDQLEQYRNRLLATPLGREVLDRIDRRFTSVTPPEAFRELLPALLELRSMRREAGRLVDALLRRGAVEHEFALRLRDAAIERAALLQKSILMTHTGRLFHLWHAIHLPFTIIMFLTLAAHVAVAVVLGYTWIF